MAPLQGDLQALGRRVVTGHQAGLARLGQHRQVQGDGVTDNREPPGLIAGEGGAAKGVGAKGPGRTEQAGAALPEPLEPLRGHHTQLLPGLDLAREGSNVIGEEHLGAAVQGLAPGQSLVAIEHKAAGRQAELQLHGPGPSRDLQVHSQGSPLAAGGGAAVEAVDLGRR